MVVGAGADERSQVGPLINDDAVAKVDALVGDALDAWRAHDRRRRRDRTAPAGSTTRRCSSTSPPDSEILREEIFGPVAPIVTFTAEDDAITLANDTEFGLVAYALHRRRSPAECGSPAGSQAGMVGLNRGLVSDPAAPFGGVKQSGIGREGGHEGVLDYTESKYVAVQW